MKRYPQLSEMGVTQTHEIVSFSVSSLGFTDVLRIEYERPSHSILPQTKTFRFPRVQKSARPNDVMETSPAFAKAVEELEQIIALKGRIEDIAGDILAEVGRLDEEVSMRSEQIRKLVARLPAVANKT